jgi:hypothetical protein
MRHRSRFIAAFGLLLVLLWPACAQAPASRTAVVTVRFFLEAERDAAAVVVLPVSGVQIGVEAKPVLSEFDLVDVQVVREELGECLGFQLSRAAARDLYRMTTMRQGRRLVLLVGDQPMGARRIDRPWADGHVQIFVERPDAVLPALAAELRASAAEMQRQRAKG